MPIDAVFPAFSDLVMLYGGALASGALTHQLDVFGSRTTGTGAFIAIALAGTIGYLLGSLVGWAIGFYGGRPFVRRWGCWFPLDAEQLARAERWFRRWEPHDAIAPPSLYFNACTWRTSPGHVVLAEPWYAPEASELCRRAAASGAARATAPVRACPRSPA